MSRRPHPGARHAAPRRGALRRVWAATAVVVGAVALGLVATGGSYALWSSSAPARVGGVVTTGTAALAVSQATGLSSRGLLPGTGAAGSLVLRNTGVVPLSVAATTDDVRAAFDGPTAGASLDELRLRAAPLPAGGSCASALADVAPSRLVGFRADVLPRLEPGSSATVCVEVLLDADAPQTVQGGVGDWSVSLEGTQVAS